VSGAPPGAPGAPDAPDGAARRRIVRDGLAVGAATGAYGLSFGALSDAAGLTLLQTCALSLLMFTGGSQFAFIGVVGAGGSAMAGVATAVLLGTRNALYGLRLGPLLAFSGARRVLGAQLVIDETTAIALAHDRGPASPGARLAFWATGLSVFVLWNAATLLGAVTAEALADPAALGLDAAVPAAFLALLYPRLRSRGSWVVAGLAVVVALLAVPVTPVGVPVLLAAATALAGLAFDGAPG
jgi:predicted branched-subunit amino acid permease